MEEAEAGAEEKQGIYFAWPNTKASQNVVQNVYYKNLPTYCHSQYITIHNTVEQYALMCLIDYNTI